MIATEVVVAAPQMVEPVVEAKLVVEAIEAVATILAENVVEAESQDVVTVLAA